MSVSILVVDDDPVQRRLLTAAIERFGYRPIAAEGGGEALARISGPEGESLALIPLAMWAHTELATRLGWYHRWPFGELIVMAASVIVLLRMWLRIRPVTKRLIALNVMAWILVGAFLWWTQVYSSYGKMETRVAVGEPAGQRLSIDGLLDENGESVDLETLLDRSEATLLVFYRGHW